jgi:arabinofuranan 3-O-arabinosyltransferase
MTLRSGAGSDIVTPDRLPVAAPPRPRGISDRWWFLLVWVTAVALFTSYHHGQIAFDTKLGVDIDPARFLGRLWPLWNPLEWFGSLQNQYIGYAIPMAPFFLLGQIAHVPVWLTERLWLSVLVTAAFAGAVRLAAALRIGSPGSRLLGGAAFALWPTFTIAMGSTSVAALPGIMMPWAVLPLVGVIRGRSGPWRAVARSGIAVALMGGVNAALIVAVLLLPALYICAGTGPVPARQRVRLALAWCAAVLVATAWWLIPLLLQGSYSFNFLPYIEQSVTTARTMSAAAVLRGAGTWTAYLNLGGFAWIPAGWIMVTSAGPVLAASVVSATGLAGLARRDMPERRWLAISVGVTALITMIAYYGPLSGPFSGAALKVFDGSLAPLRSTYKFEPMAGAAIALGCAHILSRFKPPGRAYAAGGAAALAIVLGGLALPQLTGQEIWQGSFTSIPSYWYQAAAWLDVHSPQQTAMVVPADAHGQFLWGSTSDDPLEVLADSPWTERGIVPYGNAGSQQLLETIESAVESGDEVPGLAAYLERAGIRYVVVRNDMSLDMTNYTPPQDANETMAQSGFERVASFGPLIDAAPDYPQVTGAVAGYAASYPAVEIFQATSQAMRSAGPVTAMNTSSTMLVNGGTDSLLQLGAQGLLSTSTPTVLAGDSEDGTPLTWAVTDGQRRADNEFGATSDYVSYTYTATGVNPPDDPLGDAGGEPRQLLPVSAAGHETVAVLSGAASVTASSAGTWASESQQYDPVNAFDDNTSTAWSEASPDTPVGQWIQIDLGRSIDIPARIGIRLLADSPDRAMASELTVTTAAGSATTHLAATGALQSLRVRPGATSWLRITISAAVNSTPGGLGAGITDVYIPGVKVTKYLRPAQSAAGKAAPDVVYSFERQPEESALARTFTTASAGKLSVGMTAQPVAGSALDSLIARLTRFPSGSYQAVASSSWEGLPEFGADGAFTGSAPWIASSSDTDPSITVRWHGTRTISTFQLTGASGLAATPSSVIVTTPGQTQTAIVAGTGVVQLSQPVSTDRLTLSFPALTHAPAQGSIWQPSQLPVGLSKIVIPGLRGLRLAAPKSSQTFRLACGTGPDVTVDGAVRKTSVSGTLGELLTLHPVQLRLCGGGLYLVAGQHDLVAGQSGTFTLASVSLRSSPVSAATAQRQVRVLSWGADSRTVRIGPGGSSYVEIHENYDKGWDATLNGQRLSPVELDGWQQGFVVPAGTGGVIELSYAPATTYHVGLVVSALLLLGLLVLALAGPRGRPLAALVLPGTTGRRIPRLALFIPLAIVILAAGGVMVIAVPVLALAAVWRPRWLPLVAAAAFAAAGVTAAATSQPTVLGSGAFSGLAQGLALIALTAALMPYPRPRPRHTDWEEPEGA